VPVCDPTNAFADFDSGCIFRPDDAYCASADPVSGCAQSICADVPGADSQGCLRQAVPDACSTADQSCELGSGLCETQAVIDCTGDGDCDDEDPCNGFETCNILTGTCQAGPPPCQVNTGDCTRVVCAPELLLPGDPTSVCVTVLGEGCFGLISP
jgi:hypothetical protein